jgi:hypothetical protein
MTPELAVILITPDRYETIRKTVEMLRAQTARRQLELVIVSPSASTLEPDGEQLRDFSWVRTVEVDEFVSTAQARAAGVRAASAPVVAFAEDHSFPEPEWAEALIRAHADGWSAVGPDVLNASPESIVGWADVLLGQRAVDPERAQVVDDLPGRNSSYKRDLLLSYGDELDTMLEMETLLHWDLRAHGRELYLETAARTSHVNHGHLPGFVREHFYVGRMFAGQRARRWSRGRRLAYAGAAPLIPIVRLSRILPALRRSSRRHGLFPRVLPPLLLGLAVGAAGEMLGYAAGPGSSGRHIVDVEFHREHH